MSVTESHGLVYVLDAGGAGNIAGLRLYSGVKLGYKMVKYLTEVTFLPVRTGGYWENQGYEWFAGV